MNTDHTHHWPVNYRPEDETLAHYVDELSKEHERMASALKVIHTWATFEGALDAGHVAKLCAQALGRE